MTTSDREEAQADEQPKGEREEKSSSSVEPRVKTEVNAEKIGTQNIYLGSSGDDHDIPLEELPDDLPSLPPGLHPFRDPRHDRLLSELEARRILLLSSYQESAAYAAAFSLVNDAHFHRQTKKALFPTRRRDKERSDLDLVAIAGDVFLAGTPQILLVEIDSWCTLFDSVLTLNWAHVGRVRDRLENHSSYLVLAVNEDLVRDEAKTARAKSTFPFYNVSHLRYLFARDLSDRAEDLERRLLAALECEPGAMDLQELYKRVADRLKDGVDAFQKFLCELEQASSLPLTVRKERLQPIQPSDVFRDDSELHKAAAFVATYLSDLSQRDFDRLVLLLLGDMTSTVERERQAIVDGKLATIREAIEERWSGRWLRDADRVFRDCHLRPVSSADGSWVVDFSEPYLRRELRGHLERHFPWYVRRQCQALQDSGVLFALDASWAAVEGLVRLFVERAIVDPAGFGSFWLLDVVRGLRIQIKGEPPPSASPEESLAWLFEQFAIGAHLQAHFHGRLALLIREMLDREALRPMVREFLEFLIAAKQHNALLGVILDLARSLRFAPHFDPLVWMRRLLDQGSPAVRAQTHRRMITLARESGPRIYEFLAVVQSWLPEEGRPFERFSFSNRVALNFLFDLCLEIAKSVPPERFGAWPSRHSLFYSLPNNPAEARKEITKLVEWILDPRGVALETADPSETMRTADVVRIGHVADLVEHWAWVLEGASEDGPGEGHALFRVVVEEIERRIGARERAWLQRSWQRRQEGYLRQAANADTSAGPARAVLVARRAKLDQLRMRFAALSSDAGSGSGASDTKRGIAP